jgi:hypothetical protein
VRVVVNCRVCEIVKALRLIVITSYKKAINRIINPNPFYSHLYKKPSTISGTGAALLSKTNFGPTGEFFARFHAFAAKRHSRMRNRLFGLSRPILCEQSC